MRVAAAALVLVPACQPSVPPAHVIIGPREIALQMEVAEFGPYGSPEDPDSPPATEFLPGDVLRATPTFADENGPLASDAFELQWVMCEPSQGCLVTVDPATLIACDPMSLLPKVPCSLGRDPVLEFKLSALDPNVLVDPGDNPLLAVATTPPVIGLLAAPPGEDVDECMRALHEREDLGDCILMERTIPLGPLSDIVKMLEALGVVVEISDSLEPLLQRPRNHLPRVREFDVVWGDTMHVVEHGGSIVVPADSMVTIVWRPGADDIERYDVVLGGVAFESEEEVFGTWVFDRDVPDLSVLVPNVSATFTVDGDVTAYAAVHDDRGSETAGWLTLEVAD